MLSKIHLKFKKMSLLLENFYKSVANKHEMLHEIGKNWATDVSERFKNGVWFTKDGDATAEPSYVSVSSLVDQYL